METTLTKIKNLGIYSAFVIASGLTSHHPAPRLASEAILRTDVRDCFVAAF